MTPAPDFRTAARAVAAVSDDVEAQVHGRFRALGGSTTRWARRDWAALADAVSRAEDWLETERPRFDRSALRQVRRALEDAVEGLA